MSLPDEQEVVTIYSIGHSNHTLETFIGLLQQHAITSLVDVRSAPYSRYVTHFNRPELEDAVERRRIRYLYLGDELGGRPTGDEYYDDESHVLYHRLAEAAFFRHGLERLIDEGAVYRTAMMCSEEDPIACHRHLLIGRVLAAEGVRVLHIRAHGPTQTEDDLKPAPTLWDELAGAETADAAWKSAWKSVRPISRRSQLPGTSSRTDEWGPDDF